MNTTTDAPVPIVSVVICVIDPHPVYFPEAVRSILTQTLTELELIIIEEPSSARCAPLLAAFDDARIRHFEHDRRTSLVAQRNRGIEHARADLIAVLDSDDIAEPERLARQVAFMDAHPEVGVLGTQLRLIDPDGETIGFRRYPTTPADVTEALSVYNSIAQPAVMYRRELVLASGGYRYSKHPATEDYELWCRLGTSGVMLANLDAPLVRYRIHPGGMKTMRLRGILHGTIEIKQMYFGGRMSRRARLRLLGERALLRMPPKLVLWLFVQATTRQASGKSTSTTR